MVDINYSLETLTGKHGSLLEVVEAIVSDGQAHRNFDGRRRAAKAGCAIERRVL